MAKVRRMQIMTTATEMEQTSVAAYGRRWRDNELQPPEDEEEEQERGRPLNGILEHDACNRPLNHLHIGYRYNEEE